jgi:hypothetical protein
VGSVEGKEIVTMNEARVFTATRIVALAIIGVLAAGLVYLGLGGDRRWSRFPPERRPEI